MGEKIALMDKINNYIISKRSKFILVLCFFIITELINQQLLTDYIPIGASVIISTVVVGLMGYYIFILLSTEKQRYKELLNNLNEENKLYITQLKDSIVSNQEKNLNITMESLQENQLALTNTIIQNTQNILEVIQEKTTNSNEKILNELKNNLEIIENRFNFQKEILNSFENKLLEDARIKNECLLEIMNQEIVDVKREIDCIVSNVIEKINICEENIKVKNKEIQEDITILVNNTNGQINEIGKSLNDKAMVINKTITESNSALINKIIDEMNLDRVNLDITNRSIEENIITTIAKSTENIKENVNSQGSVLIERINEGIVNNQNLINSNFNNVDIKLAEIKEKLENSENELKNVVTYKADEIKDELQSENNLLRSVVVSSYEETKIHSKNIIDESFVKFDIEAAKVSETLELNKNIVLTSIHSSIEAIKNETALENNRVKELVANLSKENQANNEQLLKENFNELDMKLSLVKEKVESNDNALIELISSKGEEIKNKADLDSKSIKDLVVSSLNENRYNNENILNKGFNEIGTKIINISKKLELSEGDLKYSIDSNIDKLKNNLILQSDKIIETMVSSFTANNELNKKILDANFNKLDIKFIDIKEDFNSYMNKLIALMNNDVDIYKSELLSETNKVMNLIISLFNEKGNSNEKLMNEYFNKFDLKLVSIKDELNEYEARINRSSTSIREKIDSALLNEKENNNINKLLLNEQNLLINKIEGLKADSKKVIDLINKIKIANPKEIVTEVAVTKNDVGSKNIKVIKDDTTGLEIINEYKGDTLLFSKMKKGDKVVYSVNYDSNGCMSSSKNYDLNGDLKTEMTYYPNGTVKERKEKINENGKIKIQTTKFDKNGMKL